jgi:hypothetical protein
VEAERDVTVATKKSFEVEVLALLVEIREQLKRQNARLAQIEKLARPVTMAVSRSALDVLSDAMLPPSWRRGV